MKKWMLVLFLAALTAVSWSQEVANVLKFTVKVPPGMFTSPVEDYTVTNAFGALQDPFHEDQDYFHRGVDLVSSKENAPIRAAADGIVTEHWLPPGAVQNGIVFKGHPAFGGMITITHAYGLITLYAHMSKTFVHEGQRVKKGQIIGIMGMTGKATGIHLHFEVHGIISGKTTLVSPNSLYTVENLEVLLDPMIFIAPVETQAQ